MGIWEIGHHMAREDHVSVTTLHVFEPRPGAGMLASTSTRESESEELHAFMA
jgi:hypothetical protein